MVLFASCGRIKTAKELYRSAKSSYGACDIVSKSETEDGTTVVLHDKLQDFDYEIYSSMNDIVIDGSSFGSVESTGDTFSRSLEKKVLSLTWDELTAICSEHGSSCSENDFALLVIRSNTESDASAAALECSKLLQEHNLNGRMDRWLITAYGSEKEDYLSDVKYGSIKLPDIRWRTTEDETTEYYIEMAHMFTDSNAEYLRKETKTFADTGADIDRVVCVLGTDYPTESSSPVTFYYFRASDGREYYLCDFNYYDENHYDYKWYSNY